MAKLPLFYRGREGGINFSRGTDNHQQNYLFIYFFLIFFVFLILISRLFQLTVVKGDYFLRLSEQNRIREFTIEAERGKILDRKGFIVAQNLPANTALNELRLTSPRTYQAPEAVAHLVGYRQLADANDIKNDNCLNKLKLGDKTGKKGVEKLYDCELRGAPGKKLAEVDAKGDYLKTLTIIPPTNGQNLQLAFDLDLQKKAYELIRDKKAAVVGVKPQTGEIILMVSSPSFDIQAFENENTDQVGRYLKDESKPLFNRVTEGAYPPGSIFKAVVATGALEEKKIDEKTLIEDTGTIKAGPITFGNWYFLQYGQTEGMVDLVKAIRRSNDIYFYKVGEKLGPEKIKFWAEKFGFGRITNIGFDESEGMIPSPFWKEENLKEDWYLGDTYNLSIGQGYLLATPLQITQAMAVFANNGNLCQPRLLKTNDYQTNCVKLPISQKTLNLIKQGMKEACSPGGTGWPLFDFKVSTACKTGTAESHAQSGLPHAWFSVFAPADNPEIILSVLIEEGGQGSDVAGPIAKDILQAYFERSE